jgi:ornithine--oxo-acid transaminase
MRRALTAEEIHSIIMANLTSEEIAAMTEEFCAHNYKPLPVALVSGDGVWLWDPEGRKYMDMMSCYSAVSVGHLHPRIVQATFEQMSKIANCSRAYYNEPLAKLGHIFTALCGMESILPMNSGAEAVETAIKLARKWGYTKKHVPDGKAEIIVCSGNFHGRTTTVISFSSEEQYKKNFGPLTPGFRFVPCGDADALESVLTEHKNVVAFLFEPIQGEAGIIVPPAGYLAKVRELCTRHNVLMIADEIQTGFCRTGKMFACQHENAHPDIYIFGKALGGGVMPISAIATSKAIMDVFRPGDHGSTFGGNPLACAVACTAIEIMVNEGLEKNSAELGVYLMERLRALNSPYIKEIRGKGLLIGLELTKASGGARRFCEALAKNGVLSKETHDYVIRFAPPLTITKEEIDWALEKIAYVFENIDRIS